MYSIYTVSQKNIPPLNCLLLCQILIDFQNFCTAGKRMKFAITAIVWPLSRLWPLFTVIEQRPDVHPWARFAGSCHSSSSPSIHCRVATVTTVAAVHRDQPIAWRPSVSSLCRQLPLLLVPLTPPSCGRCHDCGRCSPQSTNGLTSVCELAVQAAATPPRPPHSTVVWPCSPWSTNGVAVSRQQPPATHDRAMV